MLKLKIPLLARTARATSRAGLEPELKLFAYIGSSRTLACSDTRLDPSLIEDAATDKTVPEVEDITKQMWLEAVHDLKVDNRRRKQQLQEMEEQKETNFDMSDIFCLLPCCCCCFCMCQKLKNRKKET